MSDTYTFTQVTRVTPRGGSVVGGQAVTITGFGFDFATGGVTFGGVAATSVVIVSNTSITAVTPEHVNGTVDVVVAGVGTGASLYTYQLPSTILMSRVPVANKQGGKQELDPQGIVKWLMEAKQRIEATPVITASQMVGTLTVAQIPELPWTKIDKAGSSLADLEARSASDLTSGVLRQPYGGTGRANAYSFAPGSFTVQDGTFAVIISHLDLSATDNVTVLGTGILAVL